MMGLPDDMSLMSSCLVRGAPTICHEGKHALRPRLSLFDRQPPMYRMSWCAVNANHKSTFSRLLAKQCDMKDGGRSFAPWPSDINLRERDIKPAQAALVKVQGGTS